MQKLILFICLSVLLSSCASTPKFDTTNVDLSANPKTVISEPGLSLDKRVLWGGTILNTQNQKDFTQIEVLSYPLSTSYIPQLDEKPLGRFILRHQGYLEPTMYSPGRSISVLGKVDRSVSGKVGDSDYLYPLIMSEQIQLWSRQYGKTRTNFHFGIGISL